MAFQVRKAIPQDANELQRLWQERKDVYLKQAVSAQFPIKSAEEWQAVMLNWLTREDAQVLVADRDGQLIGYMVGWIRENLPLLHPERYGLVSEMSVDGHCKQGGVGTAMLDGMKQWFKSHQLEYVQVLVPRVQPSEQAFWRSVGARQYVDYLWVGLE